MNDLGHGPLLNPNQSPKLVMMHMRNHLDLLLNIFTTLAKDFIASYFSSQSSQILKVDDPSLTTQSFSRSLCHIQYVTFLDIVNRDS